MRLASMLGIACALMVGPAFAAPAGVPSQAQLGALPGRITAALLAHDVRTLRTLCMPSAHVVDDFPPFLWTGADACVRFANDFAALAKRVHLTGLSGATRRTSTTQGAGRLYVVTRVTRTPDADGKPLPEDGTWTFIMTRSAGAWKIASMTWATISP